MDAYSDFASVYDIFMDETPYEAWAAFLHEELIRQQIGGGIVLELGCGTGSLTRLLAGYGYDMIGIDNSPQMLQIAREKDEEHSSILYLLQDMREFELYGTVAAVVSVCDSINYITQEDDLLQVFSLVNNYLDPDGIFIFDFNTEYKYRDVIGDTVIAEN
ncbi:MAG: class I SAM-dependent methyltransferase, partial [Lachnospiraceae bacterium]|nr:class I SAM-dependent methyltransferase [Lachnospiraceae bacterium]